MARARQTDSMPGVGVLNQPRTVESILGGPSPFVRCPQYGQRGLHDILRVAGEVAGLKRLFARFTSWATADRQREANRAADSVACVARGAPEPARTDVLKPVLR